jgi:hypothetical protein
VQVQLQSGGTIQPVSESDIALLLPKGRLPAVKLRFDIPTSISGPVAHGDPIGHVIVLDGGEVITTVDAICPASNSAEQFQPISSGVPAASPAAPPPIIGRSAQGITENTPLTTRSGDGR